MSIKGRLQMDFSRVIVALCLWMGCFFYVFRNMDLARKDSMHSICYGLGNFFVDFLMFGCDDDESAGGRICGMEFFKFFYVAVYL